MHVCADYIEYIWISLSSVNVLICMEDIWWGPLFYRSAYTKRKVTQLFVDLINPKTADFNEKRI